MAAMTEAGTDVRAARLSIEVDVPCERCGYNLRGLTAPGRCPECGRDLERSYWAWRRRTQPLPPPDPQWVRRIREGAWLSVATFVLMLLTVSVVDRDPEWYRLRYRNAALGDTPARVCVLAAACAWWVLAWASAWRLGTVEQSPNGRLRRAVFARGARVLTSAHLLMPFMWAWATWSGAYVRSNSLWGYAVWVSLLCGFAGAFAILVCVGDALRRLGGKVAAVEAWILAFVLPASTFLATFAMRDRGDTSSLSLMFKLPAHPYGLPALNRAIVHSVPRALGDPDFWVYMIFLAVPLWCVWLQVRLLRRTRTHLPS
jgi:hypothetical protein